MKTNHIDHANVVMEFRNELKKLLEGNSTAPIQRSVACQEPASSKVPPRKLVKLPPHEHLLFSGLRSD